MRTRIVVALATTFVLLSASWAVTSAQESEREPIASARTPSMETPREERVQPRPIKNERLSGSYVLAQPVDVVQHRVDRAIQRAVSRMSFFTRGFGAGRLRETNPIRRTMRTDVTDQRVTIAYGNLTYATLNGRWRTVRDPQGNQVRLRQTVRGDQIEQIFRSNEGTKLTMYRFSENGDRVTLDITVRSPRLPEPLRYSLAYRRATQQPRVASR